ncbi:hypothetical protein [Aneurinibacillus migulanus]|uniref:Uncharacterized protein n=1 Tax=Aneurinibacillus migulanus TaxID=47500 RepID=A0A0D1YIU2_ANEMI|nr:hypothetical protein [Aneurinibacillus migulanus]KIV58692.1 hypothetical protein TS65_04760 [Aneurinibacillus migulanus]KON96382.1 hypothetical protein AF333_13750 [Aneurinibacillus migulanus]MED0892315.1 hypothetical protein [Aneurinibacillus migulanus]MED1615733.1 hypothetical protein [Aneurinibacillus migulanus]SDI22558.1 hypothetical protein SAMN04487909_102184 [Aneurinibacillus migulanus]
MHASTCSLVFFSQGRDTPLCDAKAGPAKHMGVSRQETVAGRFRPWRHTLHTRKTKGTHAVRVILFYPSMDTKGVDCFERKIPPQLDTNKAFRLPSRAVAPARRKRTATVSLFASTQMFCDLTWMGQKASRYASVRRRTDARLGHGVVATHSE